MILTLYYMYATVLQWWRLGTLKNKIHGTLSSHNSLLLSTPTNLATSKKSRSFENLLFENESRLACTIVPKLKIHMSQYATFPKDLRQFPIFINSQKVQLRSPNIHVLIKTILDTYQKQQRENIQVENFGELVAWKAGRFFEVILKTDLDNLTKLVHCYTQGVLEINHELEVFEIETVDIDGNPHKIKYDKYYPLEETLKYSYASQNWSKFSSNVKELYSKIRSSTNPKIKIETGSSTPPKTEENKKVPINEVKPIKKQLESKKTEKTTHELKTPRLKTSKPLENTGTKPKTKEPIPKNEKSPEKPKKTRDESPKIKKDSKSPKTEKPQAKTTKDKEEETPKQTKEKLETPRSRSKLKSLFSSKTDPKTSPKQPEIKKKDDKKHKKDKSPVKILKELVEVDVKVEKTHLKEQKNQESVQKLENDVSPVETSKNDRTKEANVKPPNILVFADSLTAKDNVKNVLQSIVNQEKYIIYDFPTTPTKISVWNDSTNLIVVCGSVPDNFNCQLLTYLVNGGNLLCLCSDFLHSVLNTFTTAEVREHELVKFSYGEWKNVKMMHHIFCYQASPAKKQFSKDSEGSNHSSGSSPVAPRTPSSAEITHNGQTYSLQVQVLGAEETWQTPSLLLATVKNSTGKAIFSQVHLEIDPNQFEDDTNKFETLKDSNQARLEIMRDILANRLDIDCSRVESSVYTPAYFLGRHDLKTKMLTECNSIKDNVLVCDKYTLVFCGKNMEPGLPTAKKLPILVHSCPSNFSTVDYFSTLNTEQIGRLIIYSDVMTSSQFILDKQLQHGLVVITRQQTNGVGRSNNSWLSPLGCACFSMQLNIPLNTPIGRRLPLVQHLAIVSVVSGIKNIPGYEELNLQIKWPNDLYANGVKIGGLIVNSTINMKDAVVNIGCGVNLDNSNPTLCINDLIKEHNLKFGTNLKTIQYETYFAIVFNELEKLLDLVEGDDVEAFFDLYYKYWMHSDAKITVQNSDGNFSNSTIIGIDEFGFLKVQLENGELSTVQPDGNTFDIMKGLISPKVF